MVSWLLMTVGSRGPWWALYHCQRKSIQSFAVSSSLRILPDLVVSLLHRSGWSWRCCPLRCDCVPRGHRLLSCVILFGKWLVGKKGFGACRFERFRLVVTERGLNQCLLRLSRSLWACGQEVTYWVCGILHPYSVLLGTVFFHYSCHCRCKWLVLWSVWACWWWQPRPLGLQYSSHPPSPLLSVA